MRTLHCGCRLDKLGRATPCLSAKALLNARDATTLPSLTVLRPEILRALITHMQAGGMTLRELDDWSRRAARNR